MPAVISKAKTKPVYTSREECLRRYKRDAIVSPAAIKAANNQKMLKWSCARVKTTKNPSKIPAPAPCKEILIQRLIIKKILVTATPESGNA